MSIDLRNAHPCPDCRQCLTNADKCQYCTESDQLRAQLETASGNARHYADRCTALESEVERLRGQSKAYFEEWGKSTARAEAAEGRADGLYRGLCDAVRASGGVANDGISDTFLILGVPAEMAARKKAQDAAESTVAGLRRALETAVDEVQTIAYGKEGDVKNDFTSGESHGWGMAYLHLCGIVGPALAASPDEHERKLKAEAVREVVEKINSLRYIALPQWGDMDSAAVVKFLQDEADRLEAANG